MTLAQEVRFLDRGTAPHIATLILLPGLSAAAMNMFLPSLNTMAEHFGVSYAVMQLSVPLYLLASAVLQILIGPLADKYGRRLITLWGIAVFLVATLGCVIAPSAEFFLACRVLQTTIAVGMVLSRAVVRDMYDQDNAASMMGYVTMGMALVPMLAPILGGFMESLLGWESIFWFLIIVGIVILIVTWADMGETAGANSNSILQQFREYPQLLGAPRFWGYALSSAFCSGAFFSFLGGAPFIGSEIYGMTPTVLGLYFGAPAVGYAIGNYVTGRLAARVGINRLVLSGCLISTIGIGISLALFLIGFQSALIFFGFMTTVGFGNGLVIPNATAGLLSVRPKLAGTASGLGGALMIGGGAALAALAGASLTVESGAFPLLYIQFLTGVAATLSILYVIRRARKIGAPEPALTE